MLIEALVYDRNTERNYVWLPYKNGVVVFTKCSQQSLLKFWTHVLFLTLSSTNISFMWLSTSRFSCLLLCSKAKWLWNHRTCEWLEKSCLISDLQSGRELILLDQVTTLVSAFMFYSILVATLCKTQMPLWVLKCFDMSL